MSYRQINQLNLPEIDREILDFWEKNDIFKRALNHRQNKPQFVFYEGPPSVNGMPGIHHVVSRTLKDLFCRYQSLKGHYVPRKAGWDTHGLPIELNTEKRLGITKDDIGTKISVDEYNLRCREDAMRYIDVWHKVTTRMGYWVDMHNPYTTFDNNYLETCWFLLQKLYNKGLVYKGYTIQPYSPAAGTGLSSHELSYAGTYREVKDVTAVAQFKIIKNSKSEALFNAAAGRDVFILSWTTTPWTLPSNTALAVGAGISYTQINTFNPYTFAPVSLILATDLVNQWFKAEAENADFAAYTPGAKIIPWQR
ncbi:MAG TPA: class I tRNA ligase family protein, partial [Chitinophagales bacterium]|nr:class I tRNA ligase family protein [Chitinophagales bacterium]